MDCETAPGLKFVRCADRGGGRVEPHVTQVQHNRTVLAQTRASRSIRLARTLLEPSVQSLDVDCHAPGCALSATVEVHGLDLIDAGAGIGARFEVGLDHLANRCRIHISIVRRGKPLISLCDGDAKLPASGRFEIRTSGLWCEVAELVPGDHATFDLEAFAVELDDPADVHTGAYGNRLALGAELDWETVGGAPLTQGAFACAVTGELLIGDDTLEVEGWGWRSFRRGAPEPVRSEIRGRSANGEWIWSEGVALVDPPGRGAPAIAEASVDGAALDQWCVGLDEPSAPHSAGAPRSDELASGWIRQPRMGDR